MSLTSVNIPSSVTTIETKAFDKVRHIAYHGNASGAPWGVRSRNGIIEGDFVYSENSPSQLMVYIGNAAAVTIPDNVTAIGYPGFCDCWGLTSVTIPNSVTSIGPSSFSGCTGLTTVNFNAVNCTTMGNSANHVFSNCPSLTTVNIGSAVTQIPQYAFAGGDRILQMSCRATVPPTVDNVNSFDDVFRSIPLYVPAASLSSYQMAYGWREFTNFQPLTNQGIDDVEDDGRAVVCLYPNPAHSSVTVAGLEPGQRVTLVDLCASASELTIDVSALMPGTYFVRPEGLPARTLVVAR